MSADAASDLAPGGYRHALAVAEFRALFAAFTVSLLGDVVAAVALTVLVFERTASPLLATLTFALAFAPHLVAGTLLSGLVDRQPPRRLMLLCDLASALVVLAMAVAALPVAALLALAAALGLIAPVGMAARAALLPELLPAGAYVAGRSLFRVVAQSAQLVGNAAGGLLVALASPRGAILVDAATFAASAAIVRLGTRRRVARGGAAGVSLARDSLRGLRRVLGDRRLRGLLLLCWLVAAAGVAPEALAAPAVAELDLPAGVTGWWLAALPAGTILGELAGIRLVASAWRRRLIVPLAAAGFVPLVLFALRPAIGPALALLVVAGACGMWHLGLDAELYDAADPALRPRVLAITSTGLMAVQGLGFVAAGAVAELLQPHQAIAVVGLAGLVVVALLAPAIRASRP